MCKNIDLRRKENAASNSAHDTAGAMVCSYAKAALWGASRYTVGHEQKILHVTKFLFQ